MELDDEIIPEEVGIDISLVDTEGTSVDAEGDADERSATIQDEDQALHFPPWKIIRLMLHLNGLTLDAGKSKLRF